MLSYSKRINIGRLCLVLISLFIQMLTLMFFLKLTNSGDNDTETDAVIIFSSVVILILQIFPLTVLSFYLDRIKTWRFIYIFIIALIPITWIILIFYLGNPLYKYYQ